MADTPPPVPRNRPKSQYVPPPIPSNRPKTSYVAPIFGSLSKSLKPQQSSKPTPTPKPRTSWSDEPSHKNHSNPVSHSMPKTEKPKPLSAKPSLFQKPHSGTSNGQVSVTLDTSGAAKAAFKAAADPETRSKAMTKQQEKDAANLGWGITKNAAKNASMDDFKKASKAASNSSSSSSATAAFGASLISSQAKKDKPLMTQDQQKQAAKLSWGIGKNIAKNVSLNDVKKASSFVSFSTSGSHTQPQPKPAQRPAPTQPPTARARPKPAGSSTVSAGLPPPPSSSSHGSVPLQATSQPRPVARSAFNLKPPTNDQSKTRAKPTIIRPGSGGQKAKPNSRSTSPNFDNNNTKKAPPPRPSGGPPAGKKGGPPPRPSSAPTAKQKTAANNAKPKRPAPKKPSLLEKHGLSSIEITPVPQPASTDLELPPRPGPGHPLYKHIVAHPHAIALYDFEAQDKDDLSFKTEDVIILTKKVDADWYIGRCRSKEGMFPAQFVRIVRDITEERKESVSSGGSDSISGPRCIAKFDYQSDNWDDLSFPDGAVIKLVERVDSDWLKGEYNGQTGLFPQGYVDVIEDIAVKSPKESPALSLVSNDNMVTALYDFDAEDGNELSFKEGDRINVTSKFSDDWLIGSLNGREGRFPTNFVDKIPASLSPSSEPDIKSVDPHAFVQHNFDAEGPGELSLRAGETVVLLEKIGDDWYKGRYKGKEGIFPKTFVEVIVDLPQQQEKKKKKSKATGLGKARYQFEGEAAEDLSFREGDSIELVRYINDEWMVGKLNGRTGQFPVNFIEIIKAIPS